MKEINNKQKQRGYAKWAWRPARLRPAGYRHGSIAALLFLAMVFSGSLKAQLAGTYSICGSGACNYSTITAAVADLNLKGVSAPVLFKISPGTYSEQVSLNLVKGASATNTITFDGGDSTKTIMSYAGNSTAPYTFKLNGATYVTIKRMSILNNVTGSTSAFAMYMTNNASYNTITNCIIKVDNATTSTGVIAVGVMGATYTTAGNNGNYNLINNNIIDGGYANVVLYGTSTTVICQGNNVTNNKMTGAYQFGIYSYYVGGFSYSGNKITLGTASGTSSGGPVITPPTKGGVTNYAIYCYYGANLTINGNTLVSNYMGMYLNYSDYSILGKISTVTNNIIYGQTNATSYGLYSYYNVKSLIYHNTVYFTAAGGYALYVTNTGTAADGTDIRDNIFYKTSSASYYFYIPTAAYVSKLDYNDYFGSVGGNFAYFNAVTYSDMASFKTANPTLNQNSVQIDPGFANLTPGSEDFHMSKTSFGVAGTYLNIATDFDGDSRCKLFPNMGADETTNGKGKPIVKFYVTSNIFPGSPSYIYQTAKAGEPKTHQWYLNGVKVSDSVVLFTTKFVAGPNTLKLVTQSCGGSDSFQQTFNVAPPTAVPYTDFLANKNSVLSGDIVSFQDLSTNGPTTWSWQVTPDSTIVAGTKVATTKYTFGTSKYQKPQIQFPYPGKYQVCLTANNSVGKGNTNCKKDYITVLPSVNIGSTKVATDAQGYLFDDGGPNGNYLATGTPSIVIAPCADSVYLVFTMFDVNCGISFLQLYEGKDPKGKRLDPCSGTGATSGFSGGATGGFTCGTACMPNTSKPDTFKAKSAMYISMTDGATAVGRGFSAYWWSKPSSTTTKLKTAFTVSGSTGDSICVNGQINFVNTTVTNPGEPSSFLWDLDGDLTTFECIGTCANAFWPYFLAGPTQVTLIGTNCGGTDTFRKTLMVYNPKAPKTTIKADNTTPAVGDVVFLTAPIPQCVEDYKWVITKSAGSGSGVASYVSGTSDISAAPQVTFSDTGYYDITLSVANLSGLQKDNLTLKKYIHVRASYCVPSVALLNQGMGISNVTLNTINNTMTQAAVEYTNFTTNQSLSTSLAIGATYPVSISRNSSLLFEPLNRSIFIDWNGDGLFTGKGEEAAEDSNSYATTWSGKITVPKTAKAGATTMRVAVNRGAYSNKPCGQNEFGEYQDYRIYVVPYNIPPVITLKGTQGLKDTIKIEQGNAFVDPGYTANSFLYGDITSKVIVTTKLNVVIPGVYLISYNVTDSIGNKAITQTRIVKITKDMSPPLLKVATPDTLYLEVTTLPLSPFPAPAVISADDLVDGPLAANVVNDAAKVTSNIVGQYIITYTVSDITGNVSTAYRVVNIIDTIKPALVLLGSSPVTVEVYNSYVDAGVKTSDNYYTSSVLNFAVKVTNNVDTAKTGSYTVTYNLTDPSGNKAATVTRTVIVSDATKPLISLNGDAIDNVDVFQKYFDPMVTVSDNYDKVGDIKVTLSGSYYTAFPVGTKPNITGAYTIVYTATDMSGNQSSVTRTVNVIDETAPDIELIGVPSVTVCRWFNYVDAGYTVTDNYDKTSAIKIDTLSTGNTLAEGLFSIMYRATDKSGNSALSGYRYVLVLADGSAQCTSAIKEGLNLDNYVSIYPNPNKGIFTINANLPAGERVGLSITNMLGQAIWTPGREMASDQNGTLNTGSFRIDLSNLPSGIYMLKIVSGNQTLTKRIEITK